MCLGVPGRIISIEDNALELRMGEVQFGELRRLICLAFTPEAEVGDYVIVHAGYAISHMDEDQATEALALLAELDEVAGEQGESTTFRLT